MKSIKKKKETATEYYHVSKLEKGFTNDHVEIALNNLQSFTSQVNDITALIRIDNSASILCEPNKTFNRKKDNKALLLILHDIVLAKLTI